MLAGLLLGAGAARTPRRHRPRRAARGPHAPLRPRRRRPGARRRQGYVTPDYIRKPPTLPPHLNGRTPRQLSLAQAIETSLAAEPGGWRWCASGCARSTPAGAGLRRLRAASCRAAAGAYRFEAAAADPARRRGRPGPASTQDFWDLVAGRSSAHRDRAAARLSRTGPKARWAPRWRPRSFAPACRWACCSRSCATSRSAGGSSGRRSCAPSSPATWPGKRRGCARCSRSRPPKTPTGTWSRAGRPTR